MNKAVGIAEVNQEYLVAAAERAVPVGYKQTEVGVIPEDWDLQTIGGVAEFSGGSQPPRSTFKFTPRSGYIRLIQIRDYKTSEYETYIPKDLAKKLCSPADIMIGRYGPPIFQILRGIEGAYNVALIKVIPKTSIVREYLYYFLKSEKLFELMELLSRRSSGQTGVELPALKSYLIPLPPKKEQTAIANALSDVDALLSELEKLIAKKQAIKTATMQQLLTGRTRLPQFALREDGSPKGYKQSELGEVPEDWEVFALLGNVTLSHGKAHEQFVSQAGEFIVVNSKFISSEGSVQKHCTVNFCPAKKGDVLMVLSDLPNGKALAKCFYTDADNIYAINQRVCIFRTNVLDSKYLFYLLNRHKYFLALDDGVTQTHILNGDIAACHVFLSREKQEQTAIATILSDMDDEIQALEQRLSKTRQIKQGMMQELLTGKTRLVTPQVAE